MYEGIDSTGGFACFQEKFLLLIILMCNFLFWVVVNVIGFRYDVPQILI